MGCFLFALLSPNTRELWHRKGLYVAGTIAAILELAFEAEDFALKIGHERRRARFPAFPQHGQASGVAQCLEIGDASEQVIVALRHVKMLV